MSNSVNIVTCEFANVIGNQKTGEVTKGFRVYDDHAKTYSNLVETLPTDDLEILKMVLDEGDDISDEMLESVHDNKTGVTINGTYYDWSEIQSLWD